MNFSNGYMKLTTGISQICRHLSLSPAYLKLRTQKFALRRLLTQSLVSLLILSLLVLLIIAFLMKVLYLISRNVFLIFFRLLGLRRTDTKKSEQINCSLKPEVKTRWMMLVKTENAHYTQKGLGDVNWHKLNN